MPSASFASIMPHEAKVRPGNDPSLYSFLIKVPAIYLPSCGNRFSARFRGELLDEPGRSVNLVRHQYIFRELAGEQFLKNADDRVGYGPVVDAKEDHWAEPVKRSIVVLRAVLENLLDRAGFAFHADNALFSDREQTLFPNAVLEIFGDVRGERRGRFVAVVPCWNRQTLGGRMNRFRELERRREPSVGLRHQRKINHTFGVNDFSEGRHYRLSFQPGKRILKIRIAAARECGTQVTRLHRAGTAAGANQKTAAGKPPSKDCRIPVGGGVAGQLVVADDGDNASAFDERGGCLGDGVVVQSLHHPHIGVGRCGSAFHDEMPVDDEVRRLHPRSRLAWIKALK